jgi:hypothetical protein
MYWPNGVPRVYAVNGPNIAHVSDDVNRRGTSSSLEEERRYTDSKESTYGAHDSENPERRGNDLNPEVPPSEADASQWEQEAIGGLCVSRSGHMFATITESSISLWQTRVCLPKCRL